MVVVAAVTELLLLLLLLYPFVNLFVFVCGLAGGRSSVVVPAAPGDCDAQLFALIVAAGQVADDNDNDREDDMADGCSKLNEICSFGTFFKDNVD